MRNSIVYQWIAQGKIDAGRVKDAKILAGVQAGKSEWLAFLRLFFLFSAVMALASGVIFFFAYNWDGMSRFVKFALIQGGLIVSTLIYLRMKGRSILRQALLLLMALFIGAWLALVGQTYQTGADPWQLFAFWALLTLPLVVVSRFEALWLLLFVLVNVALALFQQVNSSMFGLVFSQQSWLLSFVGLNVVFLVLIEALSYAFIAPAWLRLAHRWPAQVVAFCLLWLILSVGFDALFEGQKYAGWSGLVFMLTCGSFFVFYRFILLDVALLAFWSLMGITMVAAILTRLLIDGSGAFLVFLVIALVVIGLSVLAGRWLMKLKAGINKEQYLKNGSEGSSS